VSPDNFGAGAGAVVQLAARIAVTQIIRIVRVRTFFMMYLVYGIHN
jgi:hypothetical protein